jgi:hypothetical protein
VGSVVISTNGYSEVIDTTTNSIQAFLLQTLKLF